ncbi:tail fiber domain-containing protein [Salmonella enterica subsp. enterica]|uniref:tail fiber domain-containing protein n=1 Tax=Enterobacteriaceae TaxID=543 RepID=UPI00084AACB9|nr:tail fiber domain-containing protein [Salmonella enterica]EBS6318037.1 tail fiber domain-containing protein [Salmonella enterica subsp. enterica serovar Weltevreden]ECC3629715.1 tail fiber domain-containing protein [Salmonella enterica subsp. enterica]EDQ4533711.1 tail fiber domain-containing protein [Salmonella enterica subsp. enterica serovar 4,[5],12:i:-]EAQ6432622.1 tail fiber domain-containing protein [Salmonella enterica]EAW9378766.1 tail fiber domain-containing protein [Salmonella en
MWYREGTISFTQGSNIVTGAGTAWNVTANGVLPGMIVIGPDNKLHEIKRVDSDTSMVLAEPYAGETQADVPCVIITTYEGDLTQFSARFTALMTRMSADSKAMRSWLTALDEVTLEAADGTEIKVKSLLQIVNEHNENQQWYRDHVDTIESESSKALAAAARSEAAAAEALNSKQAAAGSEANAKASENAAAASQQAAATSESNARASKEAAAASQTAALQSEQAAAASQNAAHQSEESAANSEASALASKEAASVSQTAAANSEQAAKASEAEAARYANDSLTYSNNAKASQDAAAESQASALESKNTAVASKDAAAASQAAAATSETNAAAHADTAKSEAEKAKQFADLLDVNNVLHKDQNLADLPNRSAARNVLQVQAVISNDPTIHGSPGDYNSFSTPLGTYELRIANNGEWRVARNDNNSTSALSIGAGGTGAENIGQARINFQIDRFNQGDGETFIQSPDKIKYLTVGNDGWGYWNTASQQFIPLGVQQGGTAANTVEGAKINFGIERFRQSATETMMYAPGNSPLRITINNDNGWGVWTDAGGGWIPLGILQGGTGATNISQARNNFGIGEADIPVFRGVHLIEKNGGNSGLIYLTNRDANGNDVSNSRIYNEIQGGLSKTTIHTFRPGGGNSYLQIDERGYLSNFSSLAIGMSDHMLGANAIAIGDSDTGFRQNGDGILQALADGQVMFAFTKSGNVAYRTIQSYAPEDARFAYVEGQRRGGANCFVGGKVEMGAFSAWRDRAAGMLVELPGTDAAVNIFKAVQWGGDWTVGMDTIRWGNGGSETHLYVRGAQYTFNDAGYASCVQWVNTSDIRLKANLKEIESAKEKVKSIKGYTYFKRNNLEEDEYSFYSEEAGVIAQDVQTVLPEAVYKISNTDFLGVSYSGVTALLVNAINEMIDDEDAQSKRIEALEDEVTALKSELTDLKVLVASLVKSPAILKGE